MGMTWRCLSRSSLVDDIEMYKKVLHSSKVFTPCIVFVSILSLSTRATYSLTRTFLPEVLMLNDEGLNSCVPHAQGHPARRCNSIFWEVHCELNFVSYTMFLRVDAFFFDSSQQE